MKLHLLAVTCALVTRIGIADEEELEIPQLELNAFVSAGTARPCHENGVIASWCNSKVNPSVECSIHPTLNAYSCKCDQDPAACPSECVAGTEAIAKTHYGIQCSDIPQDEPNYVISFGKPAPQHHCENNALVASWCNEATNPSVDCLLLTSLDEYVCTCYDNSAACPEDCVGGKAPDKRSKHGIRCKGVPVDSPNYVLQA